MTPLEPGFEPTQTDVICARGRTAYNHEGNRTFRGILERNLAKYQGATTKQQKTTVVNALLEEIKEHSRFVRKLADGKWVQVPEHVAKEKIGQGFRDLLHHQYRSSTKSKVKLRRERRRRQKSQQEQHGKGDPARPEGVARATHSSDTFEPLPLDESTASTESLIYECHPFDFAAKEDAKATADDDVLDAKPKASENVNVGETKDQGDPQPQAHHETTESSSTPTFVSPASPPSANRQSMAYHQASAHSGESPNRPPPSHHHAPTWEQPGAPHFLPPPPHYSPQADYHSSRQYYSSPYPPPDYHRGQPPPAHYHPPPSHYHPHPTSPQRGGWTHLDQYEYDYGRYQGRYYTPPWSYPHYRGYSYEPSPQDYHPRYTPAVRRQEDTRERVYEYPPESRSRDEHPEAFEPPGPP